MPSAREARQNSLVETRLNCITTLFRSSRNALSSVSSQRSCQNVSLRANQPKSADLKSDGLLAPLFAPKPDALQQRNVGSISELLELEGLESLFDYEDDADDYGSPVDSADDDAF